MSSTSSPSSHVNRRLVEAHHGAHVLPVLPGQAVDPDPTVTSAHDGGQRRVALVRWRQAQRVRQRADRALEHRDVDHHLLAEVAGRDRRGERGRGCERPDRQLGEAAAAAHPHPRAARQTVGPRPSPHRLQREVGERPGAVRTVLTGDRDPDHHERVGRGGQLRWSEFEALERSRSQALHHEIRASHQLEEGVGPGRFRQRRVHVALARVQRGEQSRRVGVDPVPGERSPPAQRVTVRRFDLHHVGTEIGKQSGAEAAATSPPTSTTCRSASARTAAKPPASPRSRPRATLGS